MSNEPVTAFDDLERSIRITRSGLPTPWAERPVLRVLHLRAVAAAGLLKLGHFLLPFMLCFSTLEATAQIRTGGDLMKWHKVTLSFEGPATGEQATPNPFMDYRLEVLFTGPSGQAYRVPGYFAADGRAADSGADSGNIWRAHLAPDETGEWTYEVFFRQGEGIAVAEDRDAGKPVSGLHGASGRFTIKPSDKTAPDFRARGRLEYVGGRYLRLRDSGEYFIKQGPDAPENFLAYAEFDGDFKTDGIKDNLVKQWEAHVRDWRPGDPTWAEGRGKGIIGALNYLHSEGLNAFSFLTFNIEGDDRNVFMYTGYDEKFRIDVSRMEQWETVFAHAQGLGLFLHFKTQESENETWHDGGDVGPERRLYYRELIARFSHHLALNWNLGEENGDWKWHKQKQESGKAQSTAQRLAMARFFDEHDPYGHHRVIHNGQEFDDVLGPDSAYTGVSLQTNREDFGNVHGGVLRWIRASEKAGKPWAVACDEPGDASHSLIPDAEDPAHDIARQNALWGTLMAGGWGDEWYFGYKHEHSDLTCQDYRSRDLFWDQCRHALEFFRNHAGPYWEMSANDEFTQESDDFVLMKDGACYLIYQKTARPLTFEYERGKYACGYFNPRTGQISENDSTALGSGVHTLTPPDAKDWLLKIRSLDGGKIRQVVAKEPRASVPGGHVFVEENGQLAVEAEHFASQSLTGQRRWYVTSTTETPGLQPDPDTNHAETASGNAYLEILPDTRRNHGDKLMPGENFSNEPGRIAILDYPVKINTPGRYYVWVRAFSTGSEDNGIHVGLDGAWPESGRRLQWCQGKQQWWWESKQRTPENHCGEPHKIYLDITEPGEHLIQFSMREDGFEFDKWIITQDRNFARPSGKGLPARPPQ